ncbi:ArsR/SmtB family transcription factor [Halobium palmae]|uniref:ArsR/SmtB family transcription factor n=1 Tax=Halobium palmae TaxID=1776492 RepID=A0ABD5S1F9_9EURY
MPTLDCIPPEEFTDADADREFLALGDAGPALNALASETAQSILAAVSREPATATEISERTGTSVQNVGYHLSRLTEAELVTVAGTRYSEKGREMAVYAAAVAGIVFSPELDSGSGPGRDPNAEFDAAE